jgi:exosome complex component RRP41
MTKVGKPERMIIGGKRLDGRELEHFRAISIEIGNLKKAAGSAVFKFGDTYAQTAVFGPQEMHPKHLQNPEKSFIKCRYAMAPFSSTERIRPGRTRRATEISKVIKEAFSDVIFLEDYPKTSIDIYIEILQADASTRCAGLNAASLALVDAGIPMKNLVSSCSVGKVDGKIVLDVGGLEDNYGEVDMAVATVADEDKFILLQMDGIVTKQELSKMLDLARKGCSQIFEMQKNALKEKYKIGEGDEQDE